MRIAYNPKTSAALTVAPSNNDITFDLSGTAIYARGVKFNGKAYNVFKKHASGNTGGYDGLVPVPSYTTTNIRFLREDGTWSIPTAMASIYIQLTNQDLDNYLDEGKWYYAGEGNSVINKPSGVDAFELYVGRNANGYRYQKLITSNGIIWFRQYNATSWQTWVRWYTDQNTDQKVLQSATTTSGFRPIILGYTNTSTPSDLSASVTQQVYTTTSIYAQPSTGSLWANKLYSDGKQVLTEHQSLANYVTLNTAQTITGIKTFNANCLQISGDTNFTTILSSKNTSINTTLRDNVWRIYHSNGNGTDRGISIWSYGTDINNEVLSISAYNIGSTLANPSSTVNSLYMHGIIKATSTITSSGFVKSNSSDSYVLLGGGGHKAESSLSVNYASSAGNTNTVNNYHASSFESYHKVIIDTTGLDSDTWYPVTMSIGTAQQTRIRIEGQTSTTGTWNSRSDKKMAVELDYTTQGSGWGFISPFRTVFLFRLGAGANDSNCVAGLGQLINSSTEYVYVRGGAKYDFYVSRYITPILQTATYTVNSQSVSPTTTSPTAISRTNALISDIPTVTSYYWANVKISSSSNAATNPTFAIATATTSVTTPLVTSSDILTLNGTSGLYLKYNNDNASSLVLTNTYFKPFNSANNKLILGSNSARWSNVYSVLGNYSGNITALGFVKSDSSDNYVLLGGGGHKLVSDFMLKTDELSNNLTTITKSLNVTQEWMDTGIKYTDLPATGTYIVQVAVYASNDGIYYGYWSGVMTWYRGSTNATDANEILLHQASHALGNNNIYLRTLNTVNSDGRHLRLQISASKNLSAAYTFTFKFKRII